MEIESFVLVSSQTNRVVGISSSSNSVVTTIQSKGIYVYDVLTQQCLTSWLVSPTFRLPLPVLLHSDTLILLKEDSSFISWNLSEKPELQRLAPQKLPSTGQVHSVISSPSLERHFLVVYKDTTISLCNLDGAPIVQQLPLKTQSQVHWAAISERASEVILTVVYSNKDHLHFAIYSIYQQENQILLKNQFQLTSAPSKSRSLLTCSFNVQSLTFILLWNTQELAFFHCATLDEFFRTGLKVNLTRELDCFKPQEVVVSCFFREDQVLLVGKSTNPSLIENTFASPKKSKVSSKEQPDIVALLWDTKLGVVIGKEILVLNESSNQTYSKLDIFNQQIVSVTSEGRSNFHLVFENAVVCCLVASSPEATLSTSLGKFADTELVLKKHKQEALVSPELTDVLFNQLRDSPNGTILSFQDSQWQKLIQPIVEQQSQQHTFFTKLSQTNNKNDFSKVFTTYCQKFPAPALECVLNFNCQVMQNWLSPFYSESIAKHCLEKQYWTNLKTLIVVGGLSFSTLPQLVDTLIQKNQTELLIVSLWYLDGITCSSLLKALQYLISPQVAKESTRLFTNPKFSAHGAVTNWILNIVMAQPVCYSSLQRSFQTLSVKETKDLAFHLLWLLNLYLDSGLRIEEADVRLLPPIQTVLAWITTILDSSFSQFILIDELSDVIIDLDSSIKSYLNVCNALMAMSGPLKEGGRRSFYGAGDLTSSFDQVNLFSGPHLDIKSQDTTKDNHKKVLAFS